MTKGLRASVFAAITITFLSLGSLQDSYADGRDDWSGYAWQRIEIGQCVASAAMLVCPNYHQKWDWKRNQWVDIALQIEPATGKMSLMQRLTNKDRGDRDHVCVTALIVDKHGEDLVVHHQNWRMSSGAAVEKSFTYASTALGTAQTIHIGSKQCRKGAFEDNAIYQRVLARIAD